MTQAEQWLERFNALIAEKRQLPDREGTLVFSDGSGMRKGADDRWQVMTAEQVAETDATRQARLQSIAKVFMGAIVKSAATTVKDQPQPLGFMKDGKLKEPGGTR